MEGFSVCLFCGVTLFGRIYASAWLKHALPIFSAFVGFSTRHARRDAEGGADGGEDGEKRLDDEAPGGAFFSGVAHCSDRFLVVVGSLGLQLQSYRLLPEAPKIGLPKPVKIC